MVYKGKGADLGVEPPHKRAFVVFLATPYLHPHPYPRWRNSQRLFNKQLKISRIISILVKRSSLTVLIA